MARREAIATILGVIAATCLLVAVNSQAAGNEETSILTARFERETVFWRQFEIAQQMVDNKDPAVLKALQPWLTHEDRHIRGNAAYVFAALGNSQGFDVIYGILEDRSDRPLGQGIATYVRPESKEKWWLAEEIRADRYYAVHLLGELRDPRALDVLLPLLSDKDVSYKVAWALGEIKDPRAIPALMESLKDPDALVRTIAIQSLVNLHATEARANIEALVSDAAIPNAGSQVAVGQTARSALYSLSQPPPKP